MFNMPRFFVVCVLVFSLSLSQVVLASDVERNDLMAREKALLQLQEVRETRCYSDLDGISLQ